MLELVLPLAMAGVAGVLVVPVMDLIKKVRPWVDSLSPTKQRVVVTILSILAVIGTEFLGTPVPEDILNADATTVQSVIAALMAFATHFVRKRWLPILLGFLRK
jgi:hypothetical protein